MSFERLPTRGWTHVPDCKRVRGPYTLEEKHWAVLAQWALHLHARSNDALLRPKAREMARYALNEAAGLFREMGFVVTTGAEGLRVYAPLSRQEQDAVRARLEDDAVFYAQVQRGGTDYYSRD